MTVDIYGHLIPSSNRQAVNRLDDLSAPGGETRKATCWKYLGKFLMVPKAGLEPAQVSPPPPQDGVSTSSTTSAPADNVWPFFTAEDAEFADY